MNVGYVDIGATDGRPVILLHGWPYDIHSYAEVAPLLAGCQWSTAPDPSFYAKKFSGKYEHRDIKGGIGHNLPQEAPEAFTKAVIDVDRF